MEIIRFLTPKSQTFYLDENSTIRQALEKFDYHKFTVVPLLDREGKYVSTVSEGDILRYIKNVANFDISRAESVTVGGLNKYRPYKQLEFYSPIEQLFDLLRSQNFVPVVDDRNVFSGIIKRRSVLDYLYSQADIKI